MDRRRFVWKAGLLVAGTALGGTVACNHDPGLVIPNLGPALPPTPVPGVTYLWASKIGCALDCDLVSGRNKHTYGAATDDGPRINAALAGATADNPITLIIDGSALISGLFLPANGYWSIAGLGGGTGFCVKTGTNNDGLHNGPPDAAVPFNPGPPAPARGMNVSLSNFTINGNQNGDSTSGMRQGSASAWYCGINLMNLDNITIENVVVVNTPSFHIRLSNVGNVTVSGCIMQSRGLSTDGLHFSGPANDITISNCQFTTGDDSIALNCPEGCSGNISRVKVTGCIFNSLSLMRLYTIAIPGSPARFSIDTVSVSNCIGTLSEGAFLIGLNNGSLPNSVASLTISDCDLTAPTVLAVAENFGSIALQNVSFVPSQSNVIWVPHDDNHLSAFVRPSPLYPGRTIVGSSLSFQNCTIIRKSNMNVAAVVLENGSMINSLEFNGFGIQDDGNYSPASALLNVESGSIQQLGLDAINSSSITSPVQTGRWSIGVVTGAGVLATNWEFPDSVMANGVPYISATTGLPSIKVDGVVEPYP